MKTVDRRTLVRGAGWAIPSAIVASAAPAFAASPVKSSGEYGLFVSTQYNGSYIGYNGANDTGTTRPTSPTAYFDAVKSGRSPESDVRWDDGNNCMTDSGEFIVNGEGSFTPVANSASGADGSYVSGSGFWWSVPTTKPATGTGYIPNSTATLQNGATFVTQIEVVLPKHPQARYTAENIMIDGKTWNKQLTGRRDTVKNRGATYLESQGVKGNWSLTKPTITERPDGGLLVTGTLTYTTTESFTVTQKGKRQYGQVEIMPGSIEVFPGYGWTSFTLTSSVKSATITYTQPAGSPSSTTLSNQLLTTATLTNRTC
ncbi:amino acid oxidase [Brachybacterium timonense]|uniref:amino acid oxidase n=1 Tax=Brachybacterium timonense TaxID=2050896 RepID=UPI000D0B02A5|nr:amino acid oxidase [Brachybacterium timonense]